MLWQFGITLLLIAAEKANGAPTNSSDNVTAVASVNCTTEERLNFNCINNDLIKVQSSLLQLFLVTAVSGIWVIYLTFFHSRLIGLIVSKIVNQFQKDAYFHIGSLSFSLLSGKLMFRDILYVTVDNSTRLQDGYIIFKWWRPYNFTTWIKQKDLNQGHTRLIVYISYIEFHQYNHTSEYERINEIRKGNCKTPVKVKPKVTKPASWRSLFPIIKFTISSGKFMFGNRLMPYTMVVSFDDGDIQYKTTEASNPLDIFMHAVDGNFGDFRVKLNPSTDFDSAVTPAMLRITKFHNQPPPRKMGSGFVVAQGSNMNMKYNWDEPGLVPEFEDKELLTQDFPIWEMHIRCGKRISLNYGPWADRQRELLWKFFFPSDYQKLKVHEAMEPGELRVVEKFFFSASFLNNADVNVYFAEQKNVSALQINTGKGSCIEMDIPMLVEPDGYSTKINGQLLFMQVTTTQSYQHFFKAETLSFNVKANYPLHWNNVQTWSCDIASTKATCTLLFAHKDFLANIMDDWSQKVPPDLMSFVPYTFAFSIKLQEFELVLPTNEHNWVDCSTRSSENAFVGLYGKQLDVDFTLPFNDFLPLTCSIPFKLDLQKGELAIFVPESNPTRNVLFNLSSNLQKWNGSTQPDKPSKEFSGQKSPAELETVLSKKEEWGWMKSEDWVKCWDVAALQVVITYTWHPVYMKTPTISHKESNLKRMHSVASGTESVENITKKPLTSRTRTKTGVTFDPTTLEADEIRVDLLMAPGSTLYLYGSLLDLLIMIKENYFGYDDVYTDFSNGINKPADSDSKEVSMETENLLNFRPLQVTLDINLSDINGVLPIHPTPVLHSPPKVKLQKLTFEMDKNYHQTRLQLLLSKLDIRTSDCLVRSNEGEVPIAEGHIVLHDLQLRGHAMFSGNGLPIGATLIEYAWLTEVLVGPVEGRFSIPQIQAMVNWAQTFIYLLKNTEHKLNAAFPGRTLPTGITWEYKKKDGSIIDETDVKYLMSRIRVDDVHLQVTEGSTLLDVTVAPLMVANGNVQERGVLEAVSAVIEDVQVRQRVRINDKVDEWLDAGEIGFGPLIAQVTMATDEHKLNDLQEDFLKFHDRKTRRLDFLWESADESLTRRTSSGVTSLIDGVRSMKSWGCSFFTPLTTKHPTFFYNQQQQKANKPVSQYVSAVDDVTDMVGGTFDDEDVFDAGMDFGMSLLVHGRKLLARSLIQTSDKVDRGIHPEQPDSKPRPVSLNFEKVKIPAGVALMSGMDERRTSLRGGKLMKMKKSSSVDTYKRSTESNLYCSAESDFKSTSTLSSGAYFSAESDVEEDTSSPSSNKSGSSSRKEEVMDVDGGVVTRPDVLDIAPTTQLAADDVLLKTPLGRKFSVKKQALSSSEALMRCYERILPSSKALPTGSDVDSPVVRFSELTQGVHASVIVKKKGNDGNRRYSVDVLNQTDDEKFNSTNINIHVKDSVNIQISPFLLDSLHQFVDAAQSMVAWQHPLAVLADLQDKCVSDSVTSHKVMTSIQLEESQTNEESVKPGFQIQVYVDSLCVNVVQATLGEDPVFNLHINKLLPVPAMSILSTRLDQIDIHFELNSKHNKLVSKILTKQRKISSASSKSSESKSKTGGRPSETNDDSGDVTVFDFIGHVAMDSLALQLRVLSEDGKLPEKTSMISIPDNSCRASFHFDDDVILPDARASVKEFESLPLQTKKRQPPPKPWGWVTMEAGCRTVVANIVKQVGDGKMEWKESPAKAPVPSNTNETARVHFEKSFLSPTDEAKGVPDDHVTNGVLNVDLVWLNVVSPLSPSQALKWSRSCRTWNLLTSTAPSISAWLDPLDCLLGSLDRYEKQRQMRKLATLNAGLVMALEKAINDNEAGRQLWDAKKHKFNVLSDMSNSIRQDASFKLCDALQRFLRDPEELTLLDASLENPLALATMEKGLQSVMAQWHELTGTILVENVRKSRKKTSSVLEFQNNRSSNRPVIKYGGNLELSMVIEPPPNQPTRIINDSGKQPLLTPELNRRGESSEQRHQAGRPEIAEQVVYKQQQSMYSWMQNPDVEAPRESFVEAREAEGSGNNSTLFNFKAVDLTADSIPASQKKFEHLLKHAGVQGQIETDDSSNAIRSLCSGSLMIKSNLKSLRIDKQNPDKMYTREAAFHKTRRDRSSRRRSYAKSDLPILLFQGFTFNASVIDTIISDVSENEETQQQVVDGSKRKGGNINNSNNSNPQPQPTGRNGQKQRSTLKVHVDSSLKQATQKVDIDLVRLLHQFVQCSDAIQQAKTDIQVNKYTEGSTSPDPMSIHRRTPSNITNASGFSGPLERPTLHRRHFSQTSGMARFHSVISDTSSISSSTDSETLTRAWQIFYRLMDLQNGVTGSSWLRVRDELEIESDRPRGLSYLAPQEKMMYPNPILTVVASVTFQIRKVSLTAEFGDLKLSILLSDLSVSVSHTQTSLSPFVKQAKSILQGKLAKIQGDITEHIPGMKKTVITCEVAASNLDAATNHKRDSCDGNTCSLRIGRILIDLPQHPASLHDVVSRGTHNFSTHLLEFSRTPTYKMSFDVVDGLPVETPSAATLPPLTPMTPNTITAIIDLSQDSSEVNDVPVVIIGEATLEGVRATANLLPSLRVSYVTETIVGKGQTGPDANFSLILSTHDFIFMSEIADDPETYPIPTKIQLPAINTSGELMNHKKSQNNLEKSEGELREGNYLRIKVRIGGFDHSLTTDLFNQLVFFHEVFMQEVNDVITKVSRGNKPVSVRSETSVHSSETNHGQSFLYELEVDLEGLRLTATTPSGNAVRLKTGTIEFQLSNRVLRSSGGKKLKNLSKYLSMFGKAHVDLALSLGTLHFNNVYPEAEPEFHQMAYFTTRLGLQNTSQHSVPPAKLNLGSKPESLQDNSVVLISLERPIFFVQPTAFDKAILIFLAYKHAYEEWTEKRMGNEGVRQATRNVVNAIQRKKPSTVVGNLFLQLSVRNLGICLPTVCDVGKYELTTQGELSSALVLTVENTLISACYDRSLVTRGQFKGFCVRFADDFQTSWDDWSPEPVEVSQGPGSKGYVIMNSFVVPDGTYEICTDTTSRQGNASVSARTSANVRWQMKGIDVQLNTKIGANLARLIDTLTLITGQDGSLSHDSTASDKLLLGSHSDSLTDVDMSSSYDATDGISSRRDKHSPGVASEGTPPKNWSYKERAKKLEQELNEQVRVVNDLKSLGAKPALIKEQEKQLHSLEASLSSMFRQTVRNRLRRSSTKNHGESLKPTHQRSLSHGIDPNQLPTPKLVHSAFATLPAGNYRERFWNDRNTAQISSPRVDFQSSDEAKQDPFVTDYDSSECEFDGDEVDGVRNVRRPLYPEDGVSSSQRTSILHTSLAGGNELDADLELVLDVRVEIDGGMIVCHPMTSSHMQTGAYAKSGVPSSRLPLNKTTTFFVPGVDVKLHYNSHNTAASEKRMQEFFTPPASPRVSKNIPDIEINTPGGGQAPTSASSGSKRACVYARFSLQSLPEMIISPFLLDFLEQTLSVIPEIGSPPEKTGAAFSDEEDDSVEDTGSEGPGAVEVFNTTMASLPVDVVVSVQVQPSQVLFNCQPMSRVECLLHIPSLELVFSSIRDMASSSQFSFLEKAEIPNGLSFTAVISDFSIYVFHQYDAQQTLDEFEPGSGRKDSLSVNLQLVKVNIVRTRKGSHPVATETGPPIGGKPTEKSSLLVNLSVLADIDNASFKYDMRRLSEILAFPRAWYRKSIARRLFFGDTNNDSVHPRSGTTSSERSEKPFNSAPTSARRPLTPKSSFHSGRSEPKSSFSDWRGVILFGVNMSRLDVVMNMSNVMGNTVWTCAGLQSNGKLSIKSSGEKEIHLSCGLENSRLTAKSGIIGGDVELRKLQASCNLFDTNESEPHHNVSVKMDSLDGRIEYMGTCIMMGRLTRACLKLRDEWKVSSNRRSVSVFVPGDVGWEDFYLIISRSTTPEVIKMLSKLEEFFTQQFHNSVRALTSWGQTSHSDVTFRRQTSVGQETYAHHRHWPPAYAAIAQSPQDGAPQYHLGGSLCLHGNEMTVVCFHGANFRSKSWVLFNLLEPNIVFSTEVQEIRESMDGNESSTLAIQSLTFNLSHDYWLKTGGPSSDPMATVSRVTRAGHQNCPPSAAPLEEWFAYVTASRNQELNMLRTLNDMNQRDGGNDPSRSRRVSNSNQSNYNHDTEIIFALPKLQLDFKTEHMQGHKEPEPEDTSNIPVVECSFVTEFTDHICVTMDVELIMFLHDLISSYLKEKQQTLSSRNRLSSIGAHSSVHADHVIPSVDPIDLRTFVCNTWQLEPTVRLISWAGRRIEPVGVDYILQKLGFSHARTTIPKWMQRGVLDILDQTLAVIVQNLVVQINNQKHKK